MGISENARSTTGTTTRVKDVSPLSGMCPICIRECTVLCEVGKSAFRGREVLYPSPERYGESTAASNKDYGLDWSHFQIMTEVRGAKGIAPDSDKAIFPNVDVRSKAGGIPIRVPINIPGLGSTDVARKNWEGLSVGAAMAGIIDIIGENVCGMDRNAEYDSKGKVKYSKELEFRVKNYRRYWDGKYGDVGVQTNVEDIRTGVDLYAIKKLGVNIIERKWGQGAKAIGGEVRISDLEYAKMLKKRGYIVHPDPSDPAIQEAFKKGVFKTFERHSRVGMPEEKGFVEDVEGLRKKGAKKVFLKTGAYNPAVVAFTLKCASRAKIDLLTFDGAGGGTGMSPVPMMQECSTPTIHLLAQVLEGIKILKRKKKYIPDIALAGGFINETQIFKAIAMSNLGDGNGPYVKAIAMARAPLCAAMKADYFVKLAEAEDLPAKFVQEYGAEPEKFFICTTELTKKYGDILGKEFAWAAVGVYTFLADRIGVGLQQLLAGCRKWKLNLIDRNDLASLSEHANRVTGIPTIEDFDRESFEEILDF